MSDNFKINEYIINFQAIILFLIFILSYSIRTFIFIYYSNQIYMPDSNNYIVEASRLLAFDFENKIELFSITMPAYSLFMCIPTLIEIYLNPMLNFENLDSILSLNFYNNEYIFSIKNKAFFIDNIFSSLIPLIIFFITKKIFKENIIAIISALGATFYPVSIFYSISILTENFYIFFILLGIYFFFEKKYFISYIIFSFSILIRPTFELLFPFLVLIHFFIFDKNKLIINFLLYILVYIFFMSPWWYFNYIKYDNFVRLHPTVGFMLYSGNNKLNTTGGGIINKDFKIENFLERKLSDPIKFDNDLKNEAIDYIINNKIVFIKSALIKLKRFYSFKLFTSKYSDTILGYIYMLSYLILFILFISSIIYIPINKYKYLYIFLIMAFYLTAVHSITISSVRYRYPLEIFMIIFSSYPVHKLLNKYLK